MAQTGTTSDSSSHQTSNNPPVIPPTSGGNSAQAQTPLPGDPEVIGIFLRYQDSLVQTIREETARDAASGQAMQNNVAAMMKLSVLDFQKIDPVYQTMKAKVDGLNAATTAYVNNLIASRASLDPLKVVDFERQRKQILADGIDQLKATLSADSWSALSAYIDGPFRAGIKITPMQASSAGGR